MRDEHETTLWPPGQTRIGDIALGVIGIRPDAAGALPSEGGRLALLGVYNPESGAPEQHPVRAGDRLSVAGRVIGIVAIAPGPFPRVVVTVGRSGSPQPGTVALP
jgi:hypothetical protein